MEQPCRCYLEGVTLSRCHLYFQENDDLNGSTYSIKPRHTDRYGNMTPYAIVLHPYASL
jgi:hypothetical protein